MSREWTGRDVTVIQWTGRDVIVIQWTGKALHKKKSSRGHSRYGLPGFRMRLINDVSALAPVGIVV